MPSNNIKAVAAKFLPNCLTGVGSYLEDLKACCLNCTKPDIIVGVSQGGAVAMSLAQNEWSGAKLLLIAPAWKTFGVKPVVSKGTVIIHGTNDWLVPLGDSEYLRKASGCRLIKVEDNHAVENSYGVILGEVDRLSIETGKHKSQEQIHTEWAAYKQACEEWRAAPINCTKMGVPITSYYGAKYGWQTSELPS